MRNAYWGKPNPGRQATPLRIASVYALVDTLWILLSDQAARLIFTDQTALTRVSMLNDWLLAGVTALLVYGIVSRAFNRDRQAHQELAESKARYQRLSQNTGEVDQFHRDDSLVHTEVVTTLLTDEQGRVVQTLDVSHDITDRKRA